LILKGKDYKVTGMFMRLGTPGEEKNEAAVRSVCRKLAIAFYPVNLEEQFKSEIISYFLEGYKQGVTPNPCVKCNNLIKFGELLRRVKDLDADFLATGHYVRLTTSDVGHSTSDVVNTYKLFRGKDKGKDQSYFLYTLTQEQLKHLLFPLGEYTKEEVRKIADKAELPYIKSESQDVCFLNRDGKILEHNDYLKKYIKLKPGPIKTIDGDKVGEHQGLPLYTIGQRRGIEVGGTGPYYVVRADYKTNTLYVVRDHEHPALYRSELTANNVNWVAGSEPVLPLNCDAVIRYRHLPIECNIKRSDLFKEDRFTYSVKFLKPQRAITPGQSVVLYGIRRGPTNAAHANYSNEDEILGGGIIN
jgi:tRNA-specific 2-thiouridylase